MSSWATRLCRPTFEARFLVLSLTKHVMMTETCHAIPATKLWASFEGDGLNSNCLIRSHLSTVTMEKHRAWKCARKTVISVCNHVASSQLQLSSSPHFGQETCLHRDCCIHGNAPSARCRGCAQGLRISSCVEECVPISELLVNGKTAILQ